MLGRTVLVTGAIAAFACGGGGGSAASGLSINGTIGGRTYAPAEGLAGPVSYNGLNAGAVLLTNNTGLCAKVASGQEPKNSQYFFIGLAEVDQSSLSTHAPTTTGDYTVWSLSGLPPSKTAVVAATVTDSSCLPIATSEARGASGKVTLTSIQGGAYAGTFDVVLQRNDGTAATDHVTGTFTSTLCASLSDAASAFFSGSSRLPCL
jgi:hypothetical protein